ncbi:MAG: hypothetical protein GY862_33590 [Gammaproteobacteria bacterium]|nr:hypothetical protein [Gammaproteobacteria bacterium]
MSKFSSLRLTAIKLSGKTRCHRSAERQFDSGTACETPVNCGHPPAPQKTAAPAGLPFGTPKHAACA